jgi:hypothetical protein
MKKTVGHFTGLGAFEKKKGVYCRDGVNPYTVHDKDGNLLVEIIDADRFIKSIKLTPKPNGEYIVKLKIGNI